MKREGQPHITVFPNKLQSNASKKNTFMQTFQLKCTNRNISTLLNNYSGSRNNKLEHCCSVKVAVRFGRGGKDQ